MTRFLWLRHGPTHQKAITGWRDVPADLSQTALIAQIREGLPAEARMISSDLIRAVATADALNRGQPRLPHDPDLREINFGAWDGLLPAEVSARDPELSRAYWENPGDLCPPEGESWNATSARIERAAQRLHQGGTVIIVAHYGAILTQLQRATGQTATEALGQYIRPLSLTEILWHEDGRRQLLRVDELPAQ
ncbi:histidine phosphatase family protein [Falsigemmobacter intermedius]|uniref:histidine phosphatase family protein n=1 Tax=Falsigemmobacter intermedius TaxID=1553448 RepID=UPI003F0803B1